MTIRVMLAIVLIISATAVSASAASMEDFIKDTFDWGAGERPKLIMSKGILLAWIQESDNIPFANEPQPILQ